MRPVGPSYGSRIEHAFMASFVRFMKAPVSVRRNAQNFFTSPYL